jgi:DNA-binding NarL/FixJ family response regulator
VLLADERPIALEDLRHLIEPDFEVVGMATDGRTLLQAVEIQRPDLVIADVSLPEIDGIEATRRLRAILPSTRVLILSRHTDLSWVRAAFAAGAHAYLIKTAAPEEIESAVQEVLRGRFYLSPAVTRALVDPVEKDAA